MDLMLGATLPGEVLACKVLDVILKMMDGQTPEQKAQLWQWYIEDMKAWRALWGLK